MLLRRATALLLLNGAYLFLLLRFDDEREPEDLLDEPEERTPEDLLDEPEERVPEDLLDEPEERTPEDLLDEPEERVPEDLLDEPEERVPEDLLDEPEERVPEDLLDEPEERVPDDLVEERVERVPDDLLDEPEERVPLDRDVVLVPDREVVDLEDVLATSRDLDPERVVVARLTGRRVDVVVLVVRSLPRESRVEVSVPLVVLVEDSPLLVLVDPRVVLTIVRVPMSPDLVEDPPSVLRLPVMVA